MSKVGRNDPCPCGSGKKYKKCCEKKENMPFFQKKKVEPIQSKGVSSIFQNAFGSQEIKKAKEKEESGKKKKTERIKETKKIKAAQKETAGKLQFKTEPGEEKEDKKD